MRLHRLEMTGVGPFRDTQIIDFDELTESGLFLIEGPTGSGKTTIIDAIVYALFGIVSGGSSSDATRIRSSYCREADPTGVTLEFSVNGQRRIIRRVPAGARDPEEPKRRATSRPVRQWLHVLDDSGTVLDVLTRSDEITTHVESLLGMRAEQFRHLAVLPQGQFAELLRKSPLERMHSLAPLLGERVYEDLQKELEAAGKAADDLRSRAAADVHVATQQLLGRLRSAVDEASALGFADEQVSAADRRAALGELLDRLQGDAVAARSTHVRLDDETTRLRETLNAAERTLAALEVAEQCRTSLEAAQLAVDSAERDLTDDALAELVTDLTRLDGSLVEHIAWESASATRAETLRNVIESGRAARERAEALRVRLADLPAQRRDLQNRIDALSECASTLASAQQAEAELTGLVDKAEQLAARQPALEAAEAELTASLAQEVSSSEAVTIAFGEWRTLESRRLAQQAAHLSSQLRPGTPCAVCGSREHPAPAPSPHDDLVTDDAVAGALAAYESTQGRLAAASAATAQARVAWESTKSEVDVLRGAIGTARLTDLPAHLADARTARAAAEDALAALTPARAEAATLQRSAEELVTTLASADQEAAAFDGQAEALRAVYAAQEDRWRAAIGAADSASALVAATRRRVANLNALRECRRDHDAAQAALPGEATSIEDAREHLLTIQGRITDTEGAAQSAGHAATMLETLVGDAADLAARLDAALTAREDTVRETADAIRLARLVSGTAPDNSRRLQLHSYALMRRFASVLAVASIHLTRMSGGKFTFELDDRAMGAGQSGLGITILDTWTGHHQDPKSLSGGESFYASLALALGLADVVQGEARGAALETLFVDEGFGSLDQDTLTLVLDQLEGLRAGGRSVGVVSHVTEMKDAISDRVEVRRQADRTSRLRMTTRADQP